MGKRRDARGSSPGRAPAVGASAAFLQVRPGPREPPHAGCNLSSAPPLPAPRPSPARPGRAGRGGAL